MREQQPAAKTMDGATWAMLIALSVLWGGSFFFTGPAVHEVPTFTLALLRVGLAALALNLGENLDPGQWAGAGGIALALLVIDGRAFGRVAKLRFNW